MNIHFIMLNNVYNYQMFYVKYYLIILKWYQNKYTPIDSVKTRSDAVEAKLEYFSVMIWKDMKHLTYRKWRVKPRINAIAERNLSRVERVAAYWTSSLQAKIIKRPISRYRLERIFEVQG